MTWRFALLLIVVVRAWPCSCGGNWPSVKEAWKSAPAVFLGTVELADPDGDGLQMMFQEQSVLIRVDEAFKGVVGGQALELHEGGTDFAAEFRTGQRATFYLQTGRTPGTWIVPPCAHSLGTSLFQCQMSLKGQSVSNAR